MKFKNKLTVFASAMGGIALISSFFFSGKQIPAANEGRSPASLSKSSPDAPRLYAPVAGQRYIYSFRRGIAFKGDLAGAKLTPVHFGGQLYIDILRSEANFFEAVISKSIQGISAESAPQVRAKVSKRGDELELFTGQVDDEEGQQHISIIKDLVSLWLFPLQSDTTGAFTARFELLTHDQNFDREKKTKLAYLSRDGNTPTILESQHYLLWSHAERIPAEVKGSESSRLGSGPSALIADNRYELRFERSTPAPTHSQNELASLRHSEALTLAKPKADLSQHPDYAKLDWRELQSRLREIDQLGASRQLELFGDLVKFLRLHPEKTEELIHQLQDPAVLSQSSGSALFRTLVGTLATVASPEALAGLRDAYRDPALASVTGRGTILAALTTTQSPIDAPTREFLAQAMQQEQDPHLAQGAAFALGSSLQTANDQQSNQAIEQIEAAWRKEREGGKLEEQMALLDVMGNSGRSEFFPELRSVLTSSAPDSLKAKAVFALRFMKDDSAQREMTSRLTDPASSLREAAAGALALAEWNEKFRPYLEQCAKTESVERIRASCRGTLGDNPQVAAAL